MEIPVSRHNLFLLAVLPTARLRRVWLTCITELIPKLRGLGETVGFIEERHMLLNVVMKIFLFPSSWVNVLSAS